MLVFAAAIELSGYLSLRADLLSFAESPFITDIIKLRLGVPIYTPVADNNSYPYTPLAPILTYAIAAATGNGTSVPALRMVQFSYVILASLIATAAAAGLAQLVHGAAPRHRLLWLAACWPLLFLVAIDPSFNPYVHSLHNDGLALLFSMTCFFLAVRHATAPRGWHLAAMALLPAIGFLIKQNQAMWVGLFVLYLLLEGTTSRKRVALVFAGGTLAGIAAAAICLMLWGDNFRYWIFSALGDKSVSLLRSARHLLAAGGYGAIGLAAGLALVRKDAPRAVRALWALWAAMFVIQVYTSGIGFVTNHLGPSVVMATAWFLVAAMSWWPAAGGESRWWDAGRQVAAAAALVLVFGGLGVVREPLNAVPADAERYQAAIEREFAGMNPDSVLLDYGSWLYLPGNILMKDRSAPVSLHVGINQARINHEALAETIERIRSHRYARILAHELDTPQSYYDYGDRGSGVKTAIMANYLVVRRIPGVRVRRWWPAGLLGEILVLEPRTAASPR